MAVVRMLDNVRQVTIKSLIEQFIAPGTQVNTDEYDIYSRAEWGFEHKTVYHGRGEYAQYEGGDGFYEVHVDTMEGCWSLLRSWLHVRTCGISQEWLPLYIGFFQFVHSLRGNSLLRPLVEALVATSLEPV